MSYCLISKKPVNTLLFAIYFSFLDIKQTVSTWLETTIALTQNLDRSLISGQELVHDFDRSLIGDREHLPVRGNVSSVRYL